MHTYTVTVTVNGTDCGTYTVTADREGQAQTRALVEYFHAADKGTAPAMVSGAHVTYTVTRND